MSAEYLTETAALMREAADSVPPGPWGTVVGTMGKLGEVTVVYGAADETGKHPQVVLDYGFEMGPAADYVAAADPTFLLAVADWLDWCARYDQVNGRALAVARAYRKEASDA